MKIVILDAKTLGDDLDLTPIDNFGEVVTYQTTLPSQTLERVESADIIITNKVVISSDIMAKAKNLKLIVISATGMNNVDLEYAKDNNIEVKNVAGYSTKSVVQHTFSILFYLLEKLAYYNEVVKSGEWSKSKLFTDVSSPFGEISNMRWGIIGMGSIGQEVAKIASSFGAEVVYYSTSGNNVQENYNRVELNELLISCDIISIHSPLNSDTQYLINKSNLPLLKDKSIILNLGRGGIINENDLANELNRREIYAGVDVLEVEPIEESNPLLHIKNPERLIITPHIAWTSIEAREKLLAGVVNNIKEFI
ncbi:D-3-phosphoglycerate dehydrogenase [hydrothermal vent metagenome]|uniref:D-3-phosphoglycerate dehydrogenase n=1 Tax=hydrothermal vent metagenome TaxID=652676 RepID=A0A1W1EHM9_9ZZZZ